jgi:hypothetical protein
MKTLLLASAAMLLTSSFAFADNPLIPNDNDHLAALGLAIDHNAVAWRNGSGIAVVTVTYRAGSVMPAPAPLLRRYASSSFALYRLNGDQK